jgi:hypothetical protein
MMPPSSRSKYKRSKKQAPRKASTIHRINDVTYQKMILFKQEFITADNLNI